jgi:hypothetical protein
VCSHLRIIHHTSPGRGDRKLLQIRIEVLEANLLGGTLSDIFEMASLRSSWHLADSSDERTSYWSRKRSNLDGQVSSLKKTWPLSMKQIQKKLVTSGEKEYRRGISIVCRK